MSHSRGAQYSSDASDDDDGAPESITLTQSKANVERLNDARQTAESNAKRKRKEKNKLKDEILKRRARETRGISVTQLNSTEKPMISCGKGEDPERHSEDEGRRTLEDRMERAMRDAQDEGDDDDEAWGGFGSGSEVEAGLSSELERASDGSDSTSEEDEEKMLEFNEDDNDSMEGVEEDELGEGCSSVRRQKEPKLDYLPEYLFSEALSKARRPSKQVASSPLKLEPERSRKPSKKRKTKDIVLGSKIVRTVAPKMAHISSAASRTLPPGKVKRFYEGHLNLIPKRSGTKRGGWDRQIANIGVMRSSSLPASNFVRNS